MLHRLKIGVAAAAAVVSLADAQQDEMPAQAEGSNQPSFRATATLVEVDVRVTDRRGRFVPDLDLGDFAVTEDGEPQKIDYWIDILARLHL